MEVTAKARFIRMSPRKVRLVVGLVRGMDVAPALAQLKFMRKAAALPVAKLIKSAVANAEHNFKMDPDSLYIKSITVDNGPVLKRWRARAFGRAAPIRKRLSHINLTLEDRLKAAPKGAKAALVKQGAGSGKPEAAPKTASAKDTKSEKKAEPKVEAGKVKRGGIFAGRKKADKSK